MKTEKVHGSYSLIKLCNEASQYSLLLALYLMRVWRRQAYTQSTEGGGLEGAQKQIFPPVPFKLLIRS